jgi:hypothetical protein
MVQVRNILVMPDGVQLASLADRSLENSEEFESPVIAHESPREAPAVAKKSKQATRARTEG